MPVSSEDVNKISKLAKLKFSEDEKKKLQNDMSRIIDYMDKINELDLSNVEPLENINETENVFRDDKKKETISREEALKNAPSKTDIFFKVPKVIKK
ncbi:MAG: Asp-tRNA(Asn)/Glu-tRNA(Gln) amidotransferase subunit GatC [Ignavibacteria bacterium]|nr:Asp-tRNA(Asn)/Glu-tRNA(Gln) amidotransferase subunit GatC [Ignavibacteria bacterium]